MATVQLGNTNANSTDFDTHSQVQSDLCSVGSKRYNVVLCKITTPGYEIDPTNLYIYRYKDGAYLRGGVYEEDGTEVAITAEQFSNEQSWAWESFTLGGIGTLSANTTY
jgi:hypothetical protein